MLLTAVLLQFHALAQVSAITQSTEVQVQVSAITQSTKVQVQVSAITQSTEVQEFRYKIENSSPNKWNLNNRRLAKKINTET